MKKRLIAFLVALISVICFLGNTGCFLLPSVPEVDTDGFDVIIPGGSGGSGNTGGGTGGSGNSGSTGGNTGGSTEGGGSGGDTSGGTGDSGNSGSGDAGSGDAGTITNPHGLLVDTSITAELTVLVPDYDGDLEKNIITAVANEFKSIYPNVTVTTVARDVSDKNYRQTLSKLWENNEQPNLIYTNTALYYYLVGNNMVYSLEPYFQTYENSGLINKSKYYTEYFDMGSWDGKRYVIPRNMDSVVTYYNTTIMRAAGIDLSGYKKNPDTWTMDAFLETCEKLVTYWKSKGYDNKKYICLEKERLDWESVWNPIMKSYGSEAYTDGKVSIDSEGTRKYINLYRSMVDKGYVPSWDVTLMNKFENNNVAFQFASNGPQFYQDQPLIADKFDFLPFPLVNGEDSKIGTGFAGWGISSTSSEVERNLAWEFLFFMMSEQGQRAMYSSGESTTPSVVKSLTITNEWAKDFKHLNLKAFTAHADKKITSDYFKGFDPKFMYNIQTELQRLARNSMTKGMDINEVLSTAKGGLASAIM